MEFTNIYAHASDENATLIAKKGNPRMDEYKTSSETFAEESAYLAGQMADLLAILQRIPHNGPSRRSSTTSRRSMIRPDDSEVILEGMGSKLKKKRGGWKPYFFQLRGTCLYYYKKQGDKTPKGIYDITFAQSDKMNLKSSDLSDLDPEYAAILEAQESENRIAIYTPTRIHHIKFDGEATIQTWLKVMHSALIEEYGEGEIDAKTSASKSLQPLVRAEAEQQWKIYKNVVDMLVTSGMIGNVSPLTSKDKIKEGYLHLRKDDPVSRGHSWKRYYFVMVGSTIYYYTSTKNDEYNGVINLRIGNVDLDEKYCKAGKWVFRVQTPLRTFILRAKHDGSMKEWLKIIDQACPSDNGDVLWKKFERVSAVVSEEDVIEAAVPIKGTKHLVFKVGKKTKKYKLKKNLITLGRDGKNTIVLDDECVSRSHIKIEITEDNKLILTDLGSSRGTKVNGEKVNCTSLKPFDVILIGETELTLQVK